MIRHTYPLSCNNCVCFSLFERWECFGRRRWWLPAVDIHSGKMATVDNWKSKSDCQPQEVCQSLKLVHQQMCAAQHYGSKERELAKITAPAANTKRKLIYWTREKRKSSSPALAHRWWWVMNGNDLLMDCQLVNQMWSHQRNHFQFIY